MSNNRVMVFIDGSNLYHSLVSNCDKYRIDFHKFAEKLVDFVDGDKYVRTHYYNVMRDAEKANDVSFINMLKNTPFYEVHICPSKLSSGDNVDVMITTDLISAAYGNHFDTAVLVSGDGDFTPVVEAVKKVGKHVVVASFENSLSHNLSDIADHVIFLDTVFFDDLWVEVSEIHGNKEEKIRSSY